MHLEKNLREGTLRRKCEDTWNDYMTELWERWTFGNNLGKKILNVAWKGWKEKNHDNSLNIKGNPRWYL